MSRHYPAPMTRPLPLVVRLRNWVGDVTLGLPALTRLAEAGYDLRLVGKGWARDLLAGHGWPVHVLPGTWRERVALLRRLRAEARTEDPGFARRINAVCYPYSFSSALEFRLAGLRAIGHAYEGRSPLLARAVPRPRGVHELEVYWHLASALLGADAPLPTRIGLRLAASHLEQAEALRQRHAIEPGCIVICPFAGGTWSKEDKTWPAFAEFAARELPAFGRSVVICPGPGEESIARGPFASARCLEGVGLGAYAALLRDAALMISNDTGPGHLAAAVGTPLVSVLGPSDPTLWRAWGPNVMIVKGARGWPAINDVRAAAARALRPV
jgi:ADP-heptose:LPS heptosyltransferase